MAAIGKFLSVQWWLIKYLNAYILTFFGIELGSNKSVMAMFKQSVNQFLAPGIEILFDHESNKITPVCIAWKKDGDLRLIGTSAKM